VRAENFTKDWPSRLWDYKGRRSANLPDNRPIKILTLTLKEKAGGWKPDGSVIFFYLTSRDGGHDELDDGMEDGSYAPLACHSRPLYDSSGMGHRGCGKEKVGGRRKRDV